MFLKSSKIHCVVLALFLAGASASPLCAQESGKKLALLVGIDKYPSGSGFSSLPFPQRDVDQLAGVLLASGYRPEHVRVLTLDKGSKEDTRFLPIGQNILTEFQLLAGDRRPEDSLLIALVGHGLTRKTKVKDAQRNEVEKSTGFFCPLNADIRDTRSMIALDDLYAALEQSKAGVKVMLVDACRDNPTEGNTGGIPFAPPSGPGLGRRALLMLGWRGRLGGCRPGGRSRRLFPLRDRGTQGRRGPGKWQPRRQGLAGRTDRVHPGQGP